MSDGKQFYEFEGFRLDRTNKVLEHNGANVPITRKVFETLSVLVENADRLVEKDELMQRIWHDRFVEESNLTYNIKMLRKALGDSANHPKFIETVPRRGYRFIAEVKEITEQNNNSQPATQEKSSASTAKNFYLSAAILIVISVGSLGLAAWIWKGNSGEAKAAILSAEFNSTKLSDTGKVFHAVISPNGQYVAYTNKVGGKESLWLRHLETANNTQIIPPSDDIYYGLVFSNDGETLFFTRDRASEPNTIGIYRIPLTGGVPQKIADKSQGWISPSPDDKQISFVRYKDAEPGINSLMLADSDGKNEREIKTSQPPHAFWANAFSPDGRTLAAAYGHSLNASQQMSLVEIDIKSGEQREMTPEKFFHVRDLNWLPNKSGLIFSASQTINDKAGIWKLNYETKTVSLISKDSVEYSGLSLTRDADRMVATTFAPDFYLYLQNSENPANFTRLTKARDRFAFAPDGKIVYASDAAGNEDLWLMESNGTNQRQLTTDKSLDTTPLVSPDNRYIFYTSNRSGESQIWRINADGSNQIQITRKEGGYARFISPDGKWLYYQSSLTGNLWKISTDGGEEIVFDEDCGYYQAFSPDSKLLAFLSRDKETKNTRIKVVSTETRKVLKIFDTPTKITSFAYFLRWRNSTTLAYLIDEINGRDRVWEQDLNKDGPQIRHDLGDEEIMDIEYSNDGESFAFIGGNWQHDAFLIKGLK